jgi:AcrR family transcriptional regulator
MVSRDVAPRTRKRPEQRREEILAAAATIALDGGLERITLRAVAERLGVRPGLVTHYFPVAEDLVVAAFVRAIASERAELIPETGSAMERIAHMVARIEGEDARDAARLWLNARHLSRCMPALGSAVQAQEELDRERLLEVIVAGTKDGVFAPGDPFSACVRIYMAADGMGAYVNDVEPFSHPAYRRFVTDTAEWALGLASGSLG